MIRINKRTAIAGLISVNLILIGAILGRVLNEVSFSTYLNQQLFPKSPMYFNQAFIEDVQNASVNLDHISTIFGYVFANLPSEVSVLPTENYYYWSFYANQQKISGNIRLDPQHREQGQLSFAFFGVNNHPQSPDDLNYANGHNLFGEEQGVNIEKISELQYLVTYGEKTVTFNLHNLSQEHPEELVLAPEEVFVERIFDESGWQLLLIFNQEAKQFSFIIDNQATAPDTLVQLQENIAVGRLSGFVFHVDSNDRHTLIGVNSDNVRRNNYFDGPFDQLADNFVADKRKEFIEQAYPYTKGEINKYGVFLDEQGEPLENRIAISPYYSYQSLEELESIIQFCREKKAGLLPCLTYDNKQDFSEPEDSNSVPATNPPSIQENKS